MRTTTRTTSRTTTTTATTATAGGSRTPGAAGRHRVALIAATLASSLVLSVPALAQPAGPDDLAPLPGDPDPEVALTVTATCDPAATTYEVAVLGGPVQPHRPFTVRIDWSSADGPEGGSVEGQAGTIATGEGAFELVAVVTYPEVITFDQQVLAAVSVSSSPESAHVVCDGGGSTDPTPDGPRFTDPDIVVATPTFTG